MSTLSERSSLGQIIGYSIICGAGFGTVRASLSIFWMRILTFCNQGTVVSMVIPQAGVSKDLLPTVTAVISATPNLGGVLGVGIIGTGVLYTFPFRVALSPEHPFSN